MVKQSEHILDVHLLKASNTPPTPAPRVKRLINAIIDYLGVIFFLSIIFLLIAFVGNEETAMAMKKGSQNGQLAARFLGAFAIFVYYVLCEYYYNGKSLGKLVTQTKVVRLNGEEPSLRHIIIRTLLRFIPLEPISYLWKNDYGWHDEWSGTMVILDD